MANPPSRAKMNRVIQAISNGCTYKLAAAAAGVSESSIYRWLRDGKEGKKPYAKFVADLAMAENAKAEHMLNLITRHAEKDWRSAAWFLERRYGYRKNVPLDECRVDANTTPMDLEPRAMLVEQSKQLQAAMTKASHAESWQAYAALQRQYLSVVQQIRVIDSEHPEQDGLDGMTDEQIMMEMEAAVLTMPPVLRQRLVERLVGTQNVVQFKKG